MPASTVRLPQNNTACSHKIFVTKHDIRCDRNDPQMLWVFCHRPTQNRLSWLRCNMLQFGCQACCWVVRCYKLTCLHHLLMAGLLFVVSTAAHPCTQPHLVHFGSSTAGKLPQLLAQATAEVIKCRASPAVELLQQLIAQPAKQICAAAISRCAGAAGARTIASSSCCARLWQNQLLKAL